MTHRALLYWMFSFLKPVRFLVLTACIYLMAYAVTDVMFLRQTGKVANYIHDLNTSLKAGTVGSIQGSFRGWLFGGSALAGELRKIVLILLVLALGMWALRYLKEVSGNKLSMNMVYYIREAVYDKLQRVGFAYHDILSTGQLINRALTDLANVRQFVQSAVLITLDMVLSVSGYIILLATLNK